MLSVTGLIVLEYCIILWYMAFLCNKSVFGLCTEVFLLYEC